MKNFSKIKQQTSTEELASLRRRIRELEQSEAERKQVEEALRESELKYRSLVDQSLLGILIVQDGRVMYANNMITEKGGYSTDELMAFSPIQVMELIHPNDREVVWNRMLSRFMGNEEPERNECRFIAKDKSTYWADVHTNVIEYSGKTAIQMCIVDISERKRAEEELQFRNVLLSTQQEASIDGILVVDEKNRILSYNRRFVEMWGLPAKLVEDRFDEPVLQFVTTKMADPRSFVQRVQYLYKHRQETSQDEILLADGRVFDRYSAPMLGSGDRYYGRVWYFRDITERKRAEEALISSESKYRNIFENAFEGIYQSTPEGRFITVNAAFARMAGYDSPEDLIESIEDIGTQLYVHPEDRKKILEIMATRGIDEGFEVDFYKKNGSTFWVVIKSRAVKDDRGEIIYYEGNVEDITLRKQAEEKLLQTLENLRKAFGTTIQAMVSAVETRDPYTAGHQLRSADLARAIATEMGLSQEKIEGVHVVCSIHDLGKLSIPAEILSKPAKLSETEFSLIKEHPWKGYEILKNVESSWPLAEIVYQHHERMDGSGYPRNLKGDEILIEARILAVCDVVESMASHRPYRAALGIDAAMEEIEKNKGILYDKTVADACLRLFREKGFQLVDA